MGIRSRDELLNSSPYGVFLLDVPNLVPSSQTLKLILLKVYLVFLGLLLQNSLLTILYWFS